MAAIKYWNGSAWVYASIGAAGANGTDFAATLITEGDLLTRSGGIATRLTRANLATDSAFANIYAPKASPTFTGNVTVPDADADGEALAYDQLGARLQGLTVETPGTAQSVTRSTGGASEIVLDSGETFNRTLVFRRANLNRWAFVSRRDSDGKGLYLYRYDDAGVFQDAPMRFDEDAVSFNDASSVKVPAATAATHAAQVSAYDATTGRLAIGGVEMGNTGWRTLVSWDTTGTYTYNSLGTLGPDFTPMPGQAGHIRIRRQNNVIQFDLLGIYTAVGVALTSGSNYDLFVPSTLLDNGLRSYRQIILPLRYSVASLTSAAGKIALRPLSDIAAYTLIVSTDGASAIGHTLTTTWPTSLPGAQFTAPFTG